MWGVGCRELESWRVGVWRSGVPTSNLQPSNLLTLPPPTPTPRKGSQRTEKKQLALGRVWVWWGDKDYVDDDPVYPSSHHHHHLLLFLVPITSQPHLSTPLPPHPTSPCHHSSTSSRHPISPPHHLTRGSLCSSPGHDKGESMQGGVQGGMQGGVQGGMHLLAYQ